MEYLKNNHKRQFFECNAICMDIRPDLRHVGTRILNMGSCRECGQYWNVGTRHKSCRIEFREGCVISASAPC